MGGPLTANRAVAHASGMLWLHDIAIADSLPCCWLVATGEEPRTRPERSALRHAVSRRVLALQAGLPEAEIVIRNEPSGRPVVEASRLAGLHLSHATRGGAVAVALAAGAVGVDVEEVTDGPIPLQALHRAEQLWLGQTPGHRRAEAFAFLWAVKEAYGKWTGEGLGETDRLAVLPAPGDGWQIAGAPGLQISTLHRRMRGRVFAAAVVMA